jgi:hypothetical protein
MIFTEQLTVHSAGEQILYCYGRYRDHNKFLPIGPVLRELNPIQTPTNYSRTPT